MESFEEPASPTGSETKLLIGIEVVRREKSASSRLYERMGFEPMKAHRLPVVARILGFAANTTLLKRVSRDA